MFVRAAFCFPCSLQQVLYSISSSEREIDGGVFGRGGGAGEVALMRAAAVMEDELEECESSFRLASLSGASEEEGVEVEC